MDLARMIPFMADGGDWVPTGEGRKAGNLNSISTSQAHGHVQMLSFFEDNIDNMLHSLCEQCAVPRPFLIVAHKEKKMR